VDAASSDMIMLATTVLDGRPDQEPFQGIEMTVRRNSFGRQVDSFEAAVTVDEIPGDDFHAVFIRAPIIEAVEGDAKVLACAPDGRIVAVQQGHLLATSFHPELTRDTRFHEYFLSLAD